MSPSAVLALALLALLAIGAWPLWGDLPLRPRIRLRAGLVLALDLLGLVAVGLLAWFRVRLDGWAGALAVGLIGAVSVLTGGPVATSILRLSDPGGPPGVPGPADPRLLRGGAWVGMLERVAITGSVLAGRPEGIAIALAIKGLGRYPELRAPAAAERFIIGTFSSVLWAVGCGAVGLALLG